MRSAHGLVLIALVPAALATFAFARDARAVCLASEIVATDPGCPASGECRITKDIAVENGCVLDFSGRDVVVTNNTRVAIGSGNVSVKAQTFRVTAGGFVDGRPGGGSIDVDASADIVIERSNALRGIIVTGDARGGTIALAAAGGIVIDGRLRANVATPEACGGEISLAAGGSILISATSDVDARGGTAGCGGTIDLIAGGTVDVRRDVDASAADGGQITVAGSEVVLGGKLVANGESGSGGTIDIAARGTIAINQAVLARGMESAEGDASGGTVTIEAETGDAIVRSEVGARGGVPDGDGGDVTITAGRSLDVQAGGKVNAEAVGDVGSGGSITLEAEVDVTVTGRVEVPGGLGYGEIGLTAGRHLVIANGALVDGRARVPGGAGAAVIAEAGSTGPGNLTVNGTINVSGSPCNGGICSSGGVVDLTGCDVTIGNAALLDARAPGPTGRGGDTQLTVRRQLEVFGKIDSTGTARLGINRLVYPSMRPAVIGNSILPVAVPTTCSEASCSQPVCRGFCLRLCDCGDGIVDEFEECDSSPTGCREGGVCGASGTALECMCADTCTGDGVVDPGEECDGPVVGETCASRGFAGGALACVDCGIDESGCDLGFCGDGVIVARAGEICEPDDLAGFTCAILGFGGGGDLACGVGCTAFDTSGCALGGCGDGILDPGEECDEGAANANEPNAPCRIDCTLPLCGDGIVDDQSGEECDDANDSDSDACLGICRAAVCGDGVLCTAPGCTSGPGGGPEQCDGLFTCCLSTCGFRNCDDGSPCTSDGCDPATGCTHDPVAGRPACDDGNACTTGDRCSGGRCTGGASLGCDDGKPCTTDRCDPRAGCVHDANDAAACDDGDACTTDRCAGGVCVGTTAGLDGIRCKVDRLLGVQCDGAALPTKLAKAIGKTVKKVDKLLGKAATAAGAGKPDKELKLRQQAAKKLDAIPKKTAKAVATNKAGNHISEACGATIDGLVQENQQLITAVVF